MLTPFLTTYISLVNLDGKDVNTFHQAIYRLQREPRQQVLTPFIQMHVSRQALPAGVNTSPQIHSPRKPTIPLFYPPQFHQLRKFIFIFPHAFSVNFLSQNPVKMITQKSDGTAGIAFETLQNLREEDYRSMLQTLAAAAQGEDEDEEEDEDEDDDETLEFEEDPYDEDDLEKEDDLEEEFEDADDRLNDEEDDDDE